MIAELAITMAPAMEKEGIVAPGEIDPAILSATNARGSRTARECRNRTLRDWRLVAQAVRPRRDKILGDPLSPPMNLAPARVEHAHINDLSGGAAIEAHPMNRGA